MLVAWRVGTLLLALYLATYGGGPHAVDEIAELGVAASLVERGTFEVDELYWTIPAAGNRADAQVAVGPTGEVWSKKGLAPSLLMAPWRGLAAAAPGLDLTFAALLAMAPVTAATGALLVVLGRTFGLSAVGAAAAGLLYGLATPAWPYSRLGFGEPAIALALVAATLAAGRGTPAGALVAGLCAALCGWSKPSALALALPLGLYALARVRPPSPTGDPTRRRVASAFAFALGLAAGLAPLAWYNLARFGSPLATGYALGAGEDFSGSLAVGLAGLLLSPYRGLVWFAPICLAALALAPLAWRRAPAGVALALAAFAITLLTYAAWWTWWGGYAWGPRFLLPGLALPSLAVPLAWGALGRRARAAVVGLAVLSALVQLPGSLVDFNPFERALRATWPGFPLEGPLFGLASSQLVAHLSRLRREGAGALDLAWVQGGHADWSLALALAAAIAAAGLALALGLRAARPDDRARSGAPASGHRPGLALDALAALTLVVAIATLLARGSRPPEGAAADLLRLAERRAAAAVPGDGTVVLASPEVPALWAHDRWAGATYGFNRDDLPREVDAERLLRLGTARHGRLWLLASNVSADDPLNGVERWLARETFAYEASASGAARLRLFLTAREAPPAPGPRPLARLADGRVELAAARVRSDPARVELVWRASDLDARGVSAFVHLYADAGAPAGQVDLPLVAALPEGADPSRFTGQAVGRYAPRLARPVGDRPLPVGVGLNRPADGARLPATTPEGAPLPGDLVPLGALPRP